MNLAMHALMIEAEQRAAGLREEHVRRLTEATGAGAAPRGSRRVGVLPFGDVVLDRAGRRRLRGLAAAIGSPLRTERARGTDRIIRIE